MLNIRLDFKNVRLASLAVLFLSVTGWSCSNVKRNANSDSSNGNQPKTIEDSSNRAEDAIFRPTGDIKGNGGHALVCKQPVNGQKPIEIVDAYETRLIHGLEIQLGGSELDYQAKIDLALDRLSGLDPLRHRTLKSWAKSFEGEARFTDSDIQFIPDNNTLLIPPGCEISQIAVQTEVVLPTDARYYINRRLWDQLDHENKAVLVVHELVYRWALELGADDSSYARRMVGLLISDGMKMYSLAEYIKVAEKLQLLKEIEIKGVLFSLYSRPGGNPCPLTLYENGNVRVGRIISPTTFNFSPGNDNVPIKFSDCSNFYENGRLRFAYAYPRHNVGLNVQLQTSPGQFKDYIFWSDGSTIATHFDEDGYWVPY